ncbi:hypothetical protein INR49_006321 [Caranx melampygus]|nr:hypothetical protein INR49_006321 [Caranx melampygus]
MYTHMFPGLHPVAQTQDVSFTWGPISQSALGLSFHTDMNDSTVESRDSHHRTSVVPECSRFSGHVGAEPPGLDEVRVSDSKGPMKSSDRPSLYLSCIDTVLVPFCRWRYRRGFSKEERNTTRNGVHEFFEFLKAVTFPIPSVTETSRLLVVYGGSLGSDRAALPLVLTMGDVLCEELEDLVHFSVHDLPTRGYVVMEEIRRQGKLCDVTLKVGDHKFSAHRIILAASIPYFHAMFTNDMVECKQDEILMQGMDPSALEALINFAYSGHVAIDQQNVQSLLIGSSFLQLQNVKDACCSFLQERLHPKNCLGVRQFAETMMCTTLYDSASSFLHQHFVEVSLSEEFLGLRTEEVLELVGCDELNVKEEEQVSRSVGRSVGRSAGVGDVTFTSWVPLQVFEAVLAWVHHDRDQREGLLPELLSKIRLPLCRPQFLSDRVQQDELVRCCHRCRDLVDEAKDFHLMPERRPHLPTFKTRQRCCTSITGLIYAVGGLNSSGDSLNVVEVFDPIGNFWERCQPMRTSRSRVGVAVVNGLLYAIGGYDGQSRLSTVEVYNQRQTAGHTFPA